MAKDIMVEVTREELDEFKRELLKDGAVKIK